jgi:MOSC domain-containing protein YiiM
MPEGRLHSINISDGGVPKRPCAACDIRKTGLMGDRQRDLRYHGGPERAVSLYSLERIEALQAEGHPIAPGSVGENLTVSGISWESMVPGAQLQVGEVTLRLTSYVPPCNTVGGSFQNRDFARVSQKVNAGWSRLYASVVKEGTVRVGDVVRLVPSLPQDTSDE